MTSTASSNGIYVILGASGNTGSIVADSLLLNGKTVRVVGRDARRLQRFADKGAEVFIADWSDAAALAKAFNRAHAAYLMLPPAKSREHQEQESAAIAQAVKESGIRYAVHLSSYGAQVPARHRACRGTPFFGRKAERDQRFECPASARCIFHGKQSQVDRDDPRDGSARKCAATRCEGHP